MNGRGNSFEWRSPKAWLSLNAFVLYENESPSNPGVGDKQALNRIATAHNRFRTTAVRLLGRHQQSCRYGDPAQTQAIHRSEGAAVWL